MYVALCIYRQMGFAFCILASNLVVLAVVPSPPPPKDGVDMGILVDFSSSYVYLLQPVNEYRSVAPTDDTWRHVLIVSYLLSMLIASQVLHQRACTVVIL